MAKFKVGELALLVARPIDSNTLLGKEIARKHSGKVVEINKIYPDAPLGVISNGYVWYGITIEGDLSFYASEHVLRKIPPEREDLGSWDQLEKDVGYKRPQMVTQ